MNSANESESDGQQYEAESREARFTEPFDHASKDPGPHKNAHPAQIHHEVSHVRFGDGETVRKDEWKRWCRPVKRADGDRINPDQTLGRIPRTRDHAPDCSTSRFARDCVLAGRGFFARF